MVFSSLVFLYVFLPVVLAGYYLLPKLFRNTFLFLSSMVFFAWGGVSYSVLLVFSISLNYVIGLLIEKRDKKKVWLVLGIGLNLLMLFIFKYTNFLVHNLNKMLHILEIPQVKNLGIILPIGISFYTFQAISYLVDLYRKECKVQNNFINLGLYISLFPQLIAGPIVRYHDIQKQIGNRQHSWEKFRSGTERFCLGLGKKLIIANTMGYIADEVFTLPAGNVSTLLAWAGIVTYSLQIYYDFAGYSDMAIGLAKMFGFDLLENFNYPYISKSIKEFWRRWHISLSSWFRDYLYIPLGGNRKGRSRTTLNLFIVFLVTGFWHGASWLFVLWGLMHGFFLFLERGKFGKLLQKLPRFVQGTYTLVVVLLAWVLFRSPHLGFAVAYYKSLFGIVHTETDFMILYKLFNIESLLVFIIAIMGAFGYFQRAGRLLAKAMERINFPMQTATLLKDITVFVFITGILLYCTATLVFSGFNPFIYYQF